MKSQFVSLFNQGIRELTPYQAGKPIETLERELGITNIIKLASNENPFGLAESAKQAIISHLSGATLYPDADGYALKEALSQKFNLKRTQITLGNGSNDLLELVARSVLHDHDEVIFSQYAFIVYPLVAQALNTHAVVTPAKNWGHDLDAMLAAITEKTKLIFIANPNNPTGTMIEPTVLEAFIQQVPAQVLILLDEAYTEFIQDADPALSFTWVERYPNFMVCRTFSKAYGLAGLRIGYLVSNTAIAEMLNRVRQPFNCNVLALVAAQAVLTDTAYLEKSVNNNSARRAELVAFCETKQLAYIPSKGNFVTLDFGQPARSFYQQLLHKGIIVRPLDNYGMPMHLRISLGTKEENDRLINELSDIIAN